MKPKRASKKKPIEVGYIPKTMGADAWPGANESPSKEVVHRKVIFAGNQKLLELQVEQIASSCTYRILLKDDPTDDAKVVKILAFLRDQIRATRGA